MPVNPRVLEAIGNPTGGKLGDIANTYVNARQISIENKRQQELLDMKKKEAEENSAVNTLEMKAKLLEYDEKKKEDNYSDSRIVAAWIDRFKQDAQANPEIATNPDVYRQYVSQSIQSIDDPDVLKILHSTPPSQLPNVRRNAQLAIDTYSEAMGDEEFSDYGKIPGTELYGQRSSKTGKYVNIKDSIDGNTSLGSSEFERHLNNLKRKGLVTEDKYNELVMQRAEGFAGEMKEGEKARLDEKQTDRYNRETKDLRNEYTKGSEHFNTIGRNIDGAFAAMDSGDTKLSEVLLNQVMSQVQDTDVRAFQMYGEFDKEFGNLAQRIQGKISRFISGTRTQTETDEIRSVLSNFNESYVKPAQAKLRNRYRELAIRQKKEPFEVVPPKNPDDIKTSTLLGKKEKIKMIKSYFPDWKPQ